MNAMTHARRTQPTAPPLKIGRPDDAFEREADRKADEVMSGAGSAAQWSLSRVSIAPPLQRKCPCGGSGHGESECEECKAKGTLQRKASGAAGMNHAPRIVHEVLRSSGAPLDRGTRSFFEPRFGHDFSRVRIHTGAQAAESARAVQADAYTVGSHIVFGSGTRVPWESRRLIAHELSHVVQQNSAQPLTPSPAGADAPGWDGGKQRLSRMSSTAPLQRQKTNLAPDTAPPIDRNVELAPHTIPMNADAVPEQQKCEQFPGGETICEVDEQSGMPTGRIKHNIDETNPCTRPCVEVHENVHVRQLQAFCPALRDCYKAADAGRRPQSDCYRMAMSDLKKRECEAYRVSVPCMENRLRSARECQSRENKDYGNRKLASEKCFRDKSCGADAPAQNRQGAKQ